MANSVYKRANAGKEKKMKLYAKVAERVGDREDKAGIRRIKTTDPREIRYATRKLYPKRDRK